MDHGYVYELLRRSGASELTAATAEFLLVRPFKIVALVVLATIVTRVGTRAARRTVRGLRARAPLGAASLRAQQRAATVGDVLAGLVRVVVWSLTALVILGEVGVNLAPLLAGAGVAGFAVGFGAQTLVRDVVSGLFILLEDQFGVGDVVTVGDTTGTVEDMTLRVTRLRSTDGSVWFVPNGEVRKVGNASMEWSRVVLDVVVRHGTDLELAQRVLREEAEAFAAAPETGSAVLDQPEVWGPQAYSGDGVTVRIVVRTEPRQQYPVARALRSRVAARLRAEGLAGADEKVLLSAGALDVLSPPPPPAGPAR